MKRICMTETRALTCGVRRGPLGAVTSYSLGRDGMYKVRPLPPLLGLELLL